MLYSDNNALPFHLLLTLISKRTMIANRLGEDIVCLVVFGVLSALLHQLLYHDYRNNSYHSVALFFILNQMLYFSS